MLGRMPNVLSATYDLVVKGGRVELVIHEGRNRQVRRMLEAVGHRVRSLHRSSYAGLTLEGLPAGRWRELRPDELEQLRRAPRAVPPQTRS